MRQLRTALLIAALLPGAAQAGVGTDSSGAPVSKIGGFVGADIDGKLRGAVAAIGGVARIADRIDVTAAARLGTTSGTYLGANVRLQQSPLTPILVAGWSVFFSDGPKVGYRFAGGVQWDVTPHLGAVFHIGVEYFPRAQRGFDSTVLVPSLGVQGRL